MKRPALFTALSLSTLLAACFENDSNTGPHNSDLDPLHWSGRLYTLCASGQPHAVFLLKAGDSAPNTSLEYVLPTGLSPDSLTIGASFRHDSLTVWIDSLDSGFTHGTFTMHRTGGSGGDTLRGTFTLETDTTGSSCPAPFSCVESLPPIQLAGEWTWRSAQASSPTRGLTAVIWTGDRLVAAGEEGKLHVSPDGIEWSAVPSGTTRQLWGLACGRPGLIAVGDSGTILTSPDGLEWTASSSGTTRNLLAATWAETRFVVTGSDGVMLMSDDGNSWTPRAVDGVASNLNAVAGSPNLILVAGSGGEILTSPDDSTWTTQKVSSYPFSSVVWTGRHYAAFIPGDYPSQRSGASYYSPDAVTWESGSAWHLPDPPRPHFLKLSRFGGQLAGISQVPPDMVTTEIIRYSLDSGASWTSDTMPQLRGIRDLAWTGSRMVAVGSDGIVTKP